MKMLNTIVMSISLASVLNFGLAQACPNPPVLVLYITNNTNYPMVVHSDETCSCFSGLTTQNGFPGNDITLKAGQTLGPINNSVDATGSCSTQSTNVWYHVKDTSGAPIVDYEFYDKAKMFSFWYTLRDSKYTITESNSSGQTPVNQTTVTLPVTDHITISQ